MSRYRRCRALYLWTGCLRTPSCKIGMINECKLSALDSCKICLPYASDNSGADISLCRVASLIFDGLICNNWELCTVDRLSTYS